MLSLLVKNIVYQVGEVAKVMAKEKKTEWDLQGG